MANESLPHLLPGAKPSQPASHQPAQTPSSRTVSPPPWAARFPARGRKEERQAEHWCSTNIVHARATLGPGLRLPREWHSSRGACPQPGKPGTCCPAVAEAGPPTFKKSPSCCRPSCLSSCVSCSDWYMLSMHSGKDWRAMAGMSAALTAPTTPRFSGSP
jgi:hypothetical protein